MESPESFVSGKLVDGAVAVAELGAFAEHPFFGPTTSFVPRGQGGDVRVGDIQRKCVEGKEHDKRIRIDLAHDVLHSAAAASI